MITSLPFFRQLYLNEFGLVELVDRRSREALLRGHSPSSPRPAAPGSGSGSGADRRPDSICCCSVCGCYGCLADFFGDGVFCSKVGAGGVHGSLVFDV